WSKEPPQQLEPPTQRLQEGAGSPASTYSQHCYRRKLPVGVRLQLSRQRLCRKWFPSRHFQPMYANPPAFVSPSDTFRRTDNSTNSSMRLPAMSWHISPTKIPPGSSTTAVAKILPRSQRTVSQARPCRTATTSAQTQRSRTRRCNCPQKAQRTQR